MRDNASNLDRMRRIAEWATTATLSAYERNKGLDADFFAAVVRMCDELITTRDDA